MDLILVVEQTLNGLQLGVMLFLMAAGLTLVFGIMNLVNLAHGSLYMVGAYLTLAAAQWTGSYAAGVVLGLAGTLVVGMLVEVITLRALYDRDHLDQVLATFGLILFFNELIAILWGRSSIYSTLPAYPHDPARDEYYGSVTVDEGAGAVTHRLDSAEGRALVSGSELLGFVEGNSVGRISARGVTDPPDRFNTWRRQTFNRPVTSTRDGGKVWEHWCTVRDIRPSHRIGSSVLRAYVSLVSALGGRFVPCVTRGRRSYGHPVQLCAMVKSGLTSEASATWDVKPSKIPAPAERKFLEATPRDCLAGAATLVAYFAGPGSSLLQPSIPQHTNGQVRRLLLELVKAAKCAAPHDEVELRRLIEVEAQGNPETLAQRRGNEAEPRGRADQRELGQVDAHRARRRSFADDEVELEILHRGIEHFLDRRAQAMDLVDEQHIARLQVGQ